MKLPPQNELSEFLGVEAQETEVWHPKLGPQKGLAFILPRPGSPFSWSIFPTLGYCQIFGSAESASPVEAFVRCDEIEINHEPEEEGGECVVMKAEGWHVCISPKNEYRIFFSIYGDRKNPLGT